MSNILMARPLSDSATLIGTTALGNDNVISNLQKRELSSIYRTSLVSEINIDMGAATEIDFIALVGHNGQGTVTIKAGTTAAVSDYTSGALDLITGTDYGLDKNMFAAKITAQTYRYWKLEIDDTGNADGYFQAGRMYLSKSFQPIINADYGLEEGLIDSSRVQRTMSGGVSAVYRQPLKTIKWSLSFGTQSEMYSTLHDFDTMRGITKDIIVIPDISDTTYFQKRSVYGTFDELAPIVNAYFGIFQKNFKVTEIL